MAVVTVYRKAHFNAAHRLFNPEWDDKMNNEVFGKCANYELIVAVKGAVDPITGFVMDMKVLKDLIKIEIEEKLDHKNLNIEVTEFKSLNPTAENIAVVIWNILRDKIGQELELTITLYETPRNYVVYSGE